MTTNYQQAEACFQAALGEDHAINDAEAEFTLRQAQILATLAVADALTQQTEEVLQPAGLQELTAKYIQPRPLLGLTTTRELLDELTTRIDLNKCGDNRIKELDDLIWYTPEGELFDWPSAIIEALGEFHDEEMCDGPEDLIKEIEVVRLLEQQYYKALVALEASSNRIIYQALQGE